MLSFEDKALYFTSKSGTCWTGLRRDVMLDNYRHVVSLGNELA